jgi:hypothetical protein
MTIFKRLITVVLDCRQKAGQGQAHQNRQNVIHDKVHKTIEKKQKVKLILSGPVTSTPSLAVHIQDPTPMLYPHST